MATLNKMLTVVSICTWAVIEKTWIIIWSDHFSKSFLDLTMKLSDYINGTITTLPSHPLSNKDVLRFFMFHKEERPLHVMEQILQAAEKMVTHFSSLEVYSRTEFLSSSNN